MTAVVTLSKDLEASESVIWSSDSICKTMLSEVRDNPILSKKGPFLFTSFFHSWCLQLANLFFGAKVSLSRGDIQVETRWQRRQRVSFRFSILSHSSTHLFWEVFAGVFVRDLKS